MSYAKTINPSHLSPLTEKTSAETQNKNNWTEPFTVASLLLAIATNVFASNITAATLVGIGFMIVGLAYGRMKVEKNGTVTVKLVLALSLALLTFAGWSARNTLDRAAEKAQRAFY